MSLSERSPPLEPSKSLASWLNGKLAAKTLYDALHSCGIDPLQQRFINIFGDNPGAPSIEIVSRMSLMRETISIDGAPGLSPKILIKRCCKGSIPQLCSASYRVFAASFPFSQLANDFDGSRGGLLSDKDIRLIRKQARFFSHGKSPSLDRSAGFSRQIEQTGQRPFSSKSVIAGIES